MDSKSTLRNMSKICIEDNNERENTWTKMLPLTNQKFKFEICKFSVVNLWTLHKTIFKVKKENGSADRNCLTRTSKLPYPNFSLEFAYVKHIIRKYWARHKISFIALLCNFIIKETLYNIHHHGLNESYPLYCSAFEHLVPAGGAVCGGLSGEALLEEVCHQGWSMWG